MPGDPDLASAAADLVRWFRSSARRLPWRTDPATRDACLLEEPRSGPALPAGCRRDPYRTWIAEIMLQQTQVSTVLEYYRRWMERFPDVGSLAAAAEEDVLALWAGLGYYSRARNILATARELAFTHGGIFPRGRDALMRLKGVGEYTAGAIASLAFNLPEPILDGNLVRVFSRVYGLDYLPDSAEGRKAYWDVARAWVEASEPALVNEGLMELGALVCVPRNPVCSRCPLASRCHARSAGRQEDLPPPKRRKEARSIQGFALVLRRGGEVLLYRPPKGALLAGLLTFPVVPVEGPPTIPALKRAWKSLHPGLPVPAFRPRPVTVTHSITHHQFRLGVAEARLGSEDAPPWPPGHAWFPADGLGNLLVSSLPRKIWAAAERPTGPKVGGPAVPYAGGG